MSKIIEIARQAIINSDERKKRKNAVPNKINYAELSEGRWTAIKKNFLQTFGVMEEQPPRAEVIEGPGKVDNDDLSSEGFRDHQEPELKISSAQAELEQTLAANFLQRVGTIKTEEGFKLFWKLALKEEQIKKDRIDRQSRKTAKYVEGRELIDKLTSSGSKHFATSAPFGAASEMGVMGEAFVITAEEIRLYRPHAPGSTPTYVEISFRDFVNNYRLDIDPPKWIETIGIISKLVTGEIPKAWWGRVVVEQIQSGEQVASVMVFRPHEVREEIKSLIRTANDAGIPLKELDEIITPVNAFNIVREAIRIEQEKERQQSLEEEASEAETDQKPKGRRCKKIFSKVRPNV